MTTAVLEQHDVVLGRQVRSIAGEDMGRVVNVVVDQSGQVRAAIIDFGGFLGVGNRKIAVDWNALHFATTANKDDQTYAVQQSASYSTTSSARAISVSGTVNPSAFAVLRLITGSNAVSSSGNGAPPARPSCS